MREGKKGTIDATQLPILQRLDIEEIQGAPVLAPSPWYCLFYGS